MNPNFAGVWIPAKLLRHPGLRSQEVLLIAQIYALQANPRLCYASNEYFSEIVNLSKSTVSEYLGALQAKGLICIMRGRDEAGREERQMFLSEQGGALFAPDMPLQADAPPSAGRTPLRNTEAPPSAGRTQNKDINTHTQAHEDWREFDQQVRDAAGSAADPTSPNIVSTYELRLLLNDRPDHPACTMDEIIDGVVRAAAWNTQRSSLMRTWDLARRMAYQARDKRLTGVPVAPTAKPKASGVDLGEVKTWPRERWAAAIKVKRRSGVGWPEAWGPEPGEAGSLVPDDLVSLWKGKE